MIDLKVTSTQVLYNKWKAFQSQRQGALPYRIAWLIHEHVLFSEVYDLLVPSEQLAYSGTMRERCLQVDGACHIIVDVRALKAWPSITDVMRMAATYPLPKNVQHVVSVGRFNEPNIFLGRIFGQFFGIDLHVVPDMPDAIEYLKQHLPDADWDGADCSVLERGSHSPGDD